MDNTLTVHDVTVSDTVAFGAGGNAIPKTAVTFFVGTHGPFRLQYDKAQATADRINMDIQNQVTLLRSVTSV